MDDNKFRLGCWAIIGFVICTITVCITYSIKANTSEFIKAGYTRAALPGYGSPQWVK